MTPRDKAISELLASGYRFERHGTNHDIYYNPSLRCSIPIKRHQFSEDALRYIRKEIKVNQRERG